MNNDSNSLTHFGVLGMRWGHRRGSDESSGSASGGKGKSSTASEDHTKVKTLKSKKLHELSNAELQVIVNRLNLEKQYKDLNKADVSAGEKFIKDFAADYAKQEAKAFLKVNAPKAVSYLSKYLTGRP